MPVIELRGVQLVRGDDDDPRPTSTGAFDPGERWVVLGPNGGGKTSLLRIASMWLHPSRGDVTVLGERLGRTDVRTLRTRIGFAAARSSTSFGRAHRGGDRHVRAPTRRSSRGGTPTPRRIGSGRGRCSTRVGAGARRDARARGAVVGRATARAARARLQRRPGRGAARRAHRRPRSRRAGGPRRTARCPRGRAGVAAGRARDPPRRRDPPGFTPPCCSPTAAPRAAGPIDDVVDARHLSALFGLLLGSSAATAAGSRGHPPRRVEEGEEAWARALDLLGEEALEHRAEEPAP